MTKKPLFVQWCAKDMLGGTDMLTNDEELAYRRLCDLIYVHDGKLEDNDKLLSRSTKMLGKWKAVKNRLIILEKIAVKDGYIWNKRCADELAKSRKKSEQAKDAANTRHGGDNELKNNNTGDADAHAGADADKHAKQDAKPPAKKGAKRHAEQPAGDLLTLNRELSSSEDTNVSSAVGTISVRTLEQQVFDVGRVILGGGAMVTKLRKALGYNDALCLEKLHESKEKADGKEWLSRIIANAGKPGFGTQQNDDDVYRNVR